MVVGLHAFKEPVLYGMRSNLHSLAASSQEQGDLSILQTGRLGPKANQDKGLKAKYVSVRNTIPVVQSVSAELSMFVSNPVYVYLHLTFLANRSLRITSHTITHSRRISMHKELEKLTLDLHSAF
jgi:hypothetical protein